MLSLPARRSLPPEQKAEICVKENLCVPCSAPKSSIQVGEEHTLALQVHGDPEPPLFGAKSVTGSCFLGMLADVKS